MRITSILWSCTLLSQAGCGIASPTPSSTFTAQAPAFTYNATHFLFRGNAFQIIGGQMDPQRIPPAYWRDRLRKARAMGLNTIFTYTFWNLLEPVQGQWNEAEGKGIATFFKLAQEEDLHVVLRPGPYICGEREWGGFPAWLSTVPDLVVRANNKPFLAASREYLSHLADSLKGLHIHEGGPILMVQVENEYGSYGNDHAYTAEIESLLHETFGDMILYTNDGTEQWTLEGGSVPGVLAEIDGDPRAGFAALKKYITDPSMKGPLLDGEYYTWSFDSWGYNRSTPNIDGFVNDITYVLSNQSASISLYMVHGGTNFGFSNGALWQGKTRAFTTSYDYGAPIDEAGRPTPLYWTLRSAIANALPTYPIPSVPPSPSLNTIPSFSLHPSTPLFSSLALTSTIHAPHPLPMESLNQSYGLTLYSHTHTSPTPLTGLLHPGDRPRDRVLIYLNGSLHGVIDSTYAYPQNISLTLTPGTHLQLLVENLGRVDYFSRGTPLANMLVDPHKGIVGDVKVGNQTVEGWTMNCIPLDQLPELGGGGSEETTQPVFFTGGFEVEGREGGERA